MEYFIINIKTDTVLGFDTYIDHGLKHGTKLVWVEDAYFPLTFSTEEDAVNAIIIISQFGGITREDLKIMSLKPHGFHHIKEKSND